jgi:hypothetical protein
LIAERDEERRDVLAMAAIARGERRAGATGAEAGRSELQSDPIRFGVGSTDVTARPGVLDHDVFDGVPPNVIVTAKVRARPEKAA